MRIQIGRSLREWFGIKALPEPEPESAPAPRVPKALQPIWRVSVPCSLYPDLFFNMIKVIALTKGEARAQAKIHFRIPAGGRLPVGTTVVRD